MKRKVGDLFLPVLQSFTMSIPTRRLRSLGMTCTPANRDIGCICKSCKKVRATHFQFEQVATRRHYVFVSPYFSSEGFLSIANRKFYFTLFLSINARSFLIQEKDINLLMRFVHQF
uniref:Uncharacterized protein n=1 Tax=Strigamia maritima TaxID=126957 RepID=T1J2Q2_STRMM